MAKKFVVALPKGGVGKTTLSRNLMEAMIQVLLRNSSDDDPAPRGLLVELDPQGNLTQGFGLRPRRIQYTIYNAMQELVKTFKPSIEKAIIQVSDNIDLVPANVLLNLATDEFASAVRRESILQRLLQPVEDQYDVILIDTYPHLGFLLTNALAWTDDVVVVLQAETDAIESTALLLEHLKSLYLAGLNDRLSVSGLVFSQVDARTRFSREAMEFARQAFSHYVKFFDDFLPRSVVFAQARAMGLSLFQYKQGAAFTPIYERLAEQILGATTRVAVKDFANILEDGFLDRILEGVDFLEDVAQEEAKKDVLKEDERVPE